MTPDSFHRTLDAALAAAHRDDVPAVCIVCKVGLVILDSDSQGRLWVRCFTCGSHYWHD